MFLIGVHNKCEKSHKTSLTHIIKRQFSSSIKSCKKNLNLISDTIYIKTKFFIKPKQKFTTLLYNQLFYLYLK